MVSGKVECLIGGQPPRAQRNHGCLLARRGHGASIVSGGPRNDAERLLGSRRGTERFPFYHGALWPL
jgi:hypothetical protein